MKREEEYLNSLRKYKKSTDGDNNCYFNVERTCGDRKHSV